MSPKSWGDEVGNRYLGEKRSCKDGSDLYRPILKAGKAEQQALQLHVWKTRPVTNYTYQKDYKGIKRQALEERNFTLHTTGLWTILETNPFKVGSITEKDIEEGPSLYDGCGRRCGYKSKRKKIWADFYSDNIYVKDKMTNLMMAPITEEMCKENNGFVCKASPYISVNKK